MRAWRLLFVVSSATACSTRLTHTAGRNVADKATEMAGAVCFEAQATVQARLEHAMKPLVEAPFGTAAVAAGVIRDTRISATRGDLYEGGPPATSQTLFNVASVSKVLTAARVVSLAHAQALSLDDPISKHLPGVNLVDKDGVDRGGAVTVRHLIQHRSGLPHAPIDLEAKVADRWSSPELLRSLTDSWELTLETAPGNYAYSNTGYALLGAIVERLAPMLVRGLHGRVSDRTRNDASDLLVMGA